MYLNFDTLFIKTCPYFCWYLFNHQYLIEMLSSRNKYVDSEFDLISFLTSFCSLDCSDWNIIDKIFRTTLMYFHVASAYKYLTDVYPSVGLLLSYLIINYELVVGHLSSLALLQRPATSYPLTPPSHTHFIFHRCNIIWHCVFRQWIKCRVFWWIIFFFIAIHTCQVYPVVRKTRLSLCASA